MNDDVDFDVDTDLEELELEIRRAERKRIAEYVRDTADSVDALVVALSRSEAARVAGEGASIALRALAEDLEREAPRGTDA